MTFVVLAPGASALACSIVHSHQDSFGHELDVDRTRSSTSGRRRGLHLSCACGWRGVLPAQDVVADGFGRPLAALS
jgi:hypothetical protein